MDDTEELPSDDLAASLTRADDAQPLSLRERKKRLAQATIEETALRLFLQRGYEQTSIQDIADAALMSPRTFFRYFASKEEALLGPLRTVQSEALGALRDVAPAATPHAALRAIFTYLARQYQEQRAGFLLRYRVVTRTPSIASLFLFALVEAEPAMCQALCAHLETATDRNDIRFLVAIHMAALRVAIEEWLERDAGNDGGEGLVTLLRPRLDYLSSGPLDRERMQ
jgi:AcrR family transcriptional regulator